MAVGGLRSHTGVQTPNTSVVLCSPPGGGGRRRRRWEEEEEEVAGCQVMEEEVGQEAETRSVG